MNVDAYSSVAACVYRACLLDADATGDLGDHNNNGDHNNRDHPDKKDKKNETKVQQNFLLVDARDERETDGGCPRARPKYFGWVSSGLVLVLWLVRALINPSAYKCLPKSSTWR